MTWPPPLRGPHVTAIYRLHTIRPHPAWVIDTFRSRDHDSSLFIVRVRTLKPDNGWLIAIYSKVLLNDVRVQRSLWLRTTHSYTTKFLFRNILKSYKSLSNFSNIFQNFLLNLSKLLIFLQKFIRFLSKFPQIFLKFQNICKYFQHNYKFSSKFFLTFQ